MKRLLVILAVLATASEARAQEYYALPPGRPPAICAGTAFVDIVGTPQDDVLQAYTRATRVWWLAGSDRLSGSPTRATCLLGGPGNDTLNLAGGGGVAHGNSGRDLIIGSDRGDVINPGKDADGVIAGRGDDKVTVRDRTAEVVDCGPGADQVKGDRSDLLIGCESQNLAGPSAPHLRPSPRRANNADAIRFTLRPPRSAPAGAYRVLYLPSCRPGSETVATLPRVRARRSVRVVARPPADAWCGGRGRLAVVRDPGYTLPAVPVARLTFTVF